MGNLKKSEKILLLGLLVVVLIFVWDRMNSAKHKATAKVAKATAVAKAKAPAVVAAAAGVVTSANDSSAQIPESVLRKFAVWGRDPFLGANRLAPQDTTEQDTTVLVWHGTAWKNGQAIAIIGPYVLREGEREGDVELLKIERDYVICRYKGKRITLFRHQSDVSY